MQLEDALSREERNMEDMEAIQMHIQVGKIIIITIIIVILKIEMYFPRKVLATNCNFLFQLYS